MPSTHEVFNQSPPLTGYDVAGDSALLDGLRREGADWAEPGLHELGPPGRFGPGSGVGPAGQREPAAAAHPRPVREPDRRGGVPPGLARADDGRGRSTGCTPLRGPTPRPGAHVARAAGLYVWGQPTPAICCPISMTYAVVPALRHAPELARRYEPLLTAAVYDPGCARPPSQARACWPACR